MQYVAKSTYASYPTDILNLNYVHIRNKFVVQILQFQGNDTKYRPAYAFLRNNVCKSYSAASFFFFFINVHLFSPLLYLSVEEQYTYLPVTPLVAFPQFTLDENLWSEVSMVEPKHLFFPQERTFILQDCFYKRTRIWLI